MHDGAAVDNVSCRRIRLEELRHLFWWTNLFRQSLGHIAQRISRPARHDEFTFPQQLDWTAPFRDGKKRINSDQKKQSIIFLQARSKAPNRVDRITRQLARSLDNFR